MMLTINFEDVKKRKKNRTDIYVNNVHTNVVDREREREKTF